jgi:hypothetical protein
MKSMVAKLQADIAEVEKNGMIDPFMLAAKYCDRFVNIHPFKDGNGRMCRLILNAILVKFAGIVVVLGEKGGEGGEYLQIASESTKVSGHTGQLGIKVLNLLYDRVGGELILRALLAGPRRRIALLKKGREGQRANSSSATPSENNLLISSHPQHP